MQKSAEEGPGGPQQRSSSAPPSVRSRADEARVDEAGDARLVERARVGDELAFAALVARYERKLIRVLFRLVHDEELARDLAQETFWKVYLRLDRFDTSRRFGPWLFRVGVNLCVDMLRRHDAPPAISIDRPPCPTWPALDLADPDPRLRQELAQEVRFVVDRLPLAYRTILVLRDLEGFSSPEVAAIVGRQEATVRWRLAKARDLFRQHWERRQELGRQEDNHHVG
jgi:RNA polymerase sigma-70 factor (ECF subfamily)